MYNHQAYKDKIHLLKNYLLIINKLGQMFNKRIVTEFVSRSLKFGGIFRLTIISGTFHRSKSHDKLKSHDMLIFSEDVKIKI